MVNSPDMAGVGGNRERDMVTSQGKVQAGVNWHYIRGKGQHMSSRAAHRAHRASRARQSSHDVE